VASAGGKGGDFGGGGKGGDFGGEEGAAPGGPSAAPAETEGGEGEEQPASEGGTTVAQAQPQGEEEGESGEQPAGEGGAAQPEPTGGASQPSGGESSESSGEGETPPEGGFGQLAEGDQGESEQAQEVAAQIAEQTRLVVGKKISAAATAGTPMARLLLLKEAVELALEAKQVGIADEGLAAHARKLHGLLGTTARALLKSARTTRSLGARQRQAMIEQVKKAIEWLRALNAAYSIRK
jgi:hypothetical protein